MQDLGYRIQVAAGEGGAEGGTDLSGIAQQLELLYSVYQTLVCISLTLIPSHA